MILRTSLLHAVGEGPLTARLEALSDGGIRTEGGRIADVGPFVEVRDHHPLRRSAGSRAVCCCPASWTPTSTTPRRA